jgi:hypothetical protein
MHCQSDYKLMWTNGSSDSLECICRMTSFESKHRHPNWMVDVCMSVGNRLGAEMGRVYVRGQSIGSRDGA